MENMIWYKGSLQKCMDYNAVVSYNERYHGVTTKWANIIQRGDDFYIKKHERYPAEMIEVEKLPEITIITEG